MGSRDSALAAKDDAKLFRTWVSHSYRELYYFSRSDVPWNQSKAGNNAAWSWSLFYPYTNISLL